MCYIKREGSYINLFCFMVLRKKYFYIWPSSYSQFYSVDSWHDFKYSSDQSVNSSDNCENERTKVLYMKVKTTFSFKVESIMGLNGEVDRIGLSHGFVFIWSKTTWLWTRQIQRNTTAIKRNNLKWILSAKALLYIRK